MQHISTVLRRYLNTPHAFWRDSVLLILAVGILFFTCLGVRPLSTPDEGRYAEIPREMALSGDFVTPRLNGIKYFEKPPLMYWTVALLGGFDTAHMKTDDAHPNLPSETALRSSVALAALLGVWAVYAFGQRILGRRAALIAAGVLATSFLYYALSRLLILDMMVSVWVTIALLSYYNAYYMPPGRGRCMGHAVFAAALALAVLTKGVLAVAITGCVIVIWLTLIRGWRRVWPCYLTVSFIVFLAIAAPWHILVALKNPEFFDFYFIHEHIERYLTTAHGRVQPLWFGLIVTLAGFLPWTPFLLLKGVRGLVRAQHPFAIFCVVWAAFVIGFFSISNSQLIPYYLPALPPLALLLGRPLSDVWQQSSAIRVPLRIIGAIFLTLAAALTALYLGWVRELDAAALPWVLMLAWVFALMGVLAWGLQNATPRRAFQVLLVPLFVVFYAFNKGAAYIQRPSVLPAVMALRAHVPPKTPLITYRMYAQDLPPYWGGVVHIFDTRGELDFGIQTENPSHALFSDAAFSDFWRQPRLVCAVTKAHKYPHFLRDYGELAPAPLYADETHVAFCNQPISEVYS